VCVFMALCILSAHVLAAEPRLAFRPGGDGQYDFDTGPLRGQLTATATGQGICSLVDTASGRELTKGQKDYGIFSFYRLLATDQRWGHSIWAFPKTVEVTADGSVHISWSPQPEHPFEIKGVFRWAAADTLDVLVEATPQLPVRRFELFVGSYFADGFACQVYAQGRAKPDPAFLPVDVNPLIAGTYLSFPRDHRTAAIIYDGRWLKPPSPVDWAVTGFMAAPLALKQDKATGLTCVLMSRPQDCFAVNMPYNMGRPEDGVAGHHSTYFSLFGTDLQAGQTARAFLRLVVGKFTPAQAVERYQEFLKKYPDATTQPAAKP
jgi:hypothetical protein